jgi:hypothetical protein
MKKSSKPKIDFVYETHRLQVEKFEEKIMDLEKKLQIAGE